MIQYIYQRRGDYQSPANGLAYGYMPIAAMDFEPMSAAGFITVETITRYTFDNRNNRATMVVTGDTNSTTTYTYDLNNRLLTKTRTEQGETPRTTIFTYDRNGNQLTQVTGNERQTHTFDAFNRLTRVERPATADSPAITAVYTYRTCVLLAGTTKRIMGSTGAEYVTTTNIWDRGNIILQRNTSGAVINRFYRGAGGHLISSDHHGFYLFNVRGDVVQRTDSSGNVLHSYRFDAFGNEIETTKNGESGSTGSVNTNPFRFGGMYWDFHTQTYMTPNRHLNPRLGRWTQPDPFFHALIGNMQSCIMQAGNLYVFVMNNPVRWRDPLGLFAWNENDDDWILVNARSTQNAGGSFSQSWSGGSLDSVTISIWGVEASFAQGDTNVRRAAGGFQVRADTFYSTIVGAAGGEMSFLGGHGAFGGRFDAYHMHIAMFASPANRRYYNMFYNLDSDFTRWGLRFAFISGTATPGWGFNPARTAGQVNATNYLERADLQFWNHLSSGVGTATDLFAGYNHFMANHSSTFAYSGRWTNSTSFTIGLTNAVGLNHGLSSEQVARAWGIDNAFSARHFGR